MTDEAALLAAVRAHPDDDTPRLVYADWCDDYGRAERAAFVRCQVALERIEEPATHAAKPVEGCLGCQLIAEERALRDLVGCDGVPVGIGSIQVTWRRGFVEACEVSAEAWVRHGDALLAAHPVKRVRLTTRLIYLIGTREGDERLYRLRGRNVVRLPAAWGDRSARTELGLLAAEWPEVVTFDLSAAAVRRRGLARRRRGR
ncbi:MAG TPA: TIGR02996 domain-containing protein [Urbifossiella sp.]|nr:TIGR02996 domain-containing protein [Urbifossiella sp.]